MAGKLMTDSLRNSLTYLVEFTRSTYMGLLTKLQDDSWTQSEITDAIVRVREHIMNVEAKGEETLLALDRNHEVCEGLKSLNINVTAFETQLEQARSTWELVLKELPNAILRVTPLVKAHSFKIRVEIEKYEETLKAYLGVVQEAAFKLYETGHEKALQLLDNALQKFQEETKRCDDMLHLANIFECPRDMQKSQEVMNMIRDILAEYKELWELDKEVTTFLSMCKESFWVRINPDGMEDVARGFLSSLKKLPRGVRESDAYNGLERLVKDFIRTCPLIAALRQPAMRDRHWMELMSLTGGTLEPPSVDPELRMADVLDLELHNYTVEVEEIADKAMKELKQEENLQSLEKTWAAVEFLMTPYMETSIPLLRLSEQDTETLEADQMTVQSMVTSRHAFFKSQTLQWQKSLSAIARVMHTLDEIQHIWSYLEPLFMGSEEVKRELPEDAERFKLVDVSVRNTLQQMWMVRNVLEACNQTPLQANLERILQELETCKKSLVDFLEGKRRFFPRFNFVSEPDLLDILSNGSVPGKIMKHIQKVFPATDCLSLKEQEGGRPSATKVSRCTLGSWIRKLSRIVSFIFPVYCSCW